MKMRADRTIKRCSAPVGWKTPRATWAWETLCRPRQKISVPPRPYLDRDDFADTRESCSASPGPTRESRALDTRIRAIGADLRATGLAPPVAVALRDCTMGTDMSSKKHGRKQTNSLSHHYCSLCERTGTI